MLAIHIYSTIIAFETDYKLEKIENLIEDDIVLHYHVK